MTGLEKLAKAFEHGRATRTELGDLSEDGNLGSTLSNLPEQLTVVKWLDPAYYYDHDPKNKAIKECCRLLFLFTEKPRRVLLGNLPAPYRQAPWEEYPSTGSGMNICGI